MPANNGRPRREVRQAAAKALLEERATRSPAQQLQVLNARVGPAGGKKERRRLEAIIKKLDDELQYQLVMENKGVNDSLPPPPLAPKGTASKPKNRRGKK